MYVVADEPDTDIENLELLEPVLDIDDERDDEEDRVEEELWVALLEAILERVLDGD